MQHKIISEKTYKALCIIKDHPLVHPRGFADFMWGDTDTNMFTSSKNQGNGSTRGKAAWLCAGSYVGRLKNKGLLHHSIEQGKWVRLTDEGKKAIAEYEKHHLTLQALKETKSF